MKNNLTIRLTNISKRYTIHHEKPTLAEKLVKFKDEEFWALKDINLEIKKGERVGIVGPNGSGKTTLLKIITGITTPTSGKVETHGRIVSLIDLEAGFHPDLTGFQNIYLNAMLLGMKKDEIDKKLSEIIAFADIDRFIDTPLFIYSEGMKLRLGFAIAINSNPDIFILDEGLSVGDAEFRQKCLIAIKQLARDKTVVFSWHDIGITQQSCDRALIMDSGCIQNEENEILISFIFQMPINRTFYAEAKTNSMYPLIRKGDRVIIKKVPLFKIKTGDIIAFAPHNLPQIFVHRLISVQKKKNEIIGITKGDNAYNLDSWEINSSNYLGKVMSIGKTQSKH